MALGENALGTGVAVAKGQLFVANTGPNGSFIPIVSTIGLNLDGTGGPAKTIADLLIALSATAIRNCNYANRFLMPVAPDGP
jgi:hypothetical protein